MKKAVVLLSGGLDSTTCLAVALHEGLDVSILTFDYGQRHRREMGCSRKIADYYGLKNHKVIAMDNVGGSALTDRGMEVPEYLDHGGIPGTYVPARNIIFLGFAAAYAEVVGAGDIFIGVNAIDYSGYPDCRPEFIESFERMLRLGTKTGSEGNAINIRAPLISMKKSEIIRLAYDLGAPLHLTSSCYSGGDKACGVCDSCALRLRGFKEAGMKDPLEYRKGAIDGI